MEQPHQSELVVFTSVRTGRVDVPSTSLGAAAPVRTGRVDIPSTSHGKPHQSELVVLIFPAGY